MENNIILKNGKTLEEALEQIRKYKKPTEKKADKPYYEIEEYVERMDSVLGRHNYVTTYSEMQIVALPTGQVIVSCKCHIDFIGMDNTPVFFCEGYGSCDISISTDTGNYLHLTTTSMNCGTFAFKSACRDIGIFECRGKKGGNTAAKQTTAVPADAKAGEHSNVPKEKRFLLEKPLEQFWKDREGKPAYRMAAKLVEDDKVTDKVCEILFYPNQYKKTEQKLNELIIRSRECQSGFRLSVMVTDVAENRRNANYAASYVFKEFVEAK